MPFLAAVSIELWSLVLELYYLPVLLSVLFSEQLGVSNCRSHNKTEWRDYIITITQLETDKPTDLFTADLPLISSFETERGHCLLACVKTT